VIDESPSAPPRVACILLAAGGSRRMGRPKQLLPWRGTTLVAHAANAAAEAGCGRVFAVVGAAREEVSAALAGTGAECVVNADWEDGLSSSIRTGLCAAQAEEARSGAPWDGALVLLADQPHVSSASLGALVARFRAVARARAIAASAYAGTLGPPAVFGRAHFPALCALEGDAGAKAVLAANEADVLAVPFEPGAVDVDTPADYHALSEE